LTHGPGSRLASRATRLAVPAAVSNARALPRRRVPPTIVPCPDLRRKRRPRTRRTGLSLPGQDRRRESPVRRPPGADAMPPHTGCRARPPATAGIPHPAPAAMPQAPAAHPAPGAARTCLPVPRAPEWLICPPLLPAAHVRSRAPIRQGDCALTTLQDRCRHSHCVAAARLLRPAAVANARLRIAPDSARSGQLVTPLWPGFAVEAPSGPGDRVASRRRVASWPAGP
jgi:hypothetical protein